MSFVVVAVESEMVLALLTIIRPIQIPPVWSVQKAAAERLGKAAQPVQLHQRSGKTRIAGH